MLENCKRSASSPNLAIGSNLAKIMQSILNHKLMKYLLDNSLLNDCQYGFRKIRITPNGITHRNMQ